ncbi:hypothetical protein J6590_024293, partial [Homalodisca vitripennis]
MEYEEVSMRGATSIRVELSVGGERLSLLAVYRSQSSDNDLELFIDGLESHCTITSRDQINCVLTVVLCFLDAGGATGRSGTLRFLVDNNYLSGN